MQADNEGLANERIRESNLNTDPSVFINCPYDPDYERLFHAIVFAVVACGFLPRCALEYATVSSPRMEKVVKALFASNYSIHDLSRCQGAGAANLARMNMPLELGMACAFKYLSAELDREHDWLVLVPNQYEYTRFVSDLAGYDLLPHDGSDKEVIERVVAWLMEKPDCPRKVTPRDVNELLDVYLAAIQRLKGEWGAHLRWSDRVTVAFKVASAL